MQKVIFKSDNEPAIIVLKRDVANDQPNVQVIPQEALIWDHQANGDIECMVREFSRRTRAKKSSIDEKTAIQGVFVEIFNKNQVIPLLHLN